MYLMRRQRSPWNIAGSQGMVASLPKVLTESGDNDDNIRTEEFTGY